MPAVRRPRTLDVPENFVPLDDLAAQRLDDAEAAVLQPPPPTPSARRFSFARLLLFALSALAALGVGLAVDELVRELFNRATWLGWTAVAFAVVALLALLGTAMRELAGLRRLTLIDDLRRRAREATETRDAAKARKVVDGLLTLYADQPIAGTGRASLQATNGQIVDGPDLLRLAERDLLAPLDTRARRMALDAAKRVSVVTAVSPRAFIDVAFVLLENVRLMRRIADLYGGRPGTLGFWRLARNIVAHLAVTGSIAVGDSVVQQVVGHGLAARLSSRLGEGVVNGLLTARVGIAAMDVCRPMPFGATERPSIGDFVADLTRRDHKNATSPAEVGPGGER